MKTKIILGLVVTLVTFGTFALNAFAATYQYVNTAGNVQNVEANNPSEALAKASNIAPHSGVMLYVGLTIVTVGEPAVLGDSTVPYVTYQYVNASGQLQTIIASNSDQAFNQAIDIALHSGVMRVNANQEGV